MSPESRRDSGTPNESGQETSAGRRIWNLIKWTVTAFVIDGVPRLGAALAFYTTIAVAPMMILTLMLTAQFFEDPEARERIVGQISQLAGNRVGDIIESVGQTAARNSERALTGISLAALVFGALGVFRHLQGALNAIWRVRTPNLTWMQRVRRRLASFGTVAVTGFLLQMSLVVSAVLTWMAENALAVWSGPAIVGEAVNIVSTFLITTLLFALVFRLLPDVDIQWRDVWLGAALTALAFALGKMALSYYLARSTLSSAYGAAGSIIALLIWTYYAAQIVFLGVEFTRVQKLSHGGREAFELREPIPDELTDRKGL